METLKNWMLRTKFYVDGAYGCVLRVMSICFIYNCVMFNHDGTVLHIGTMKQLPTVVTEAHAEERGVSQDHINIDTRCDAFLNNVKNWRICRQNFGKQEQN